MRGIVFGLSVLLTVAGVDVVAVTTHTHLWQIFAGDVLLGVGLGVFSAMVERSA